MASFDVSIVSNWEERTYSLRQGSGIWMRCSPEQELGNGGSDGRGGSLL